MRTTSTRAGRAAERDRGAHVGVDRRLARGTYTTTWQDRVERRTPGVEHSSSSTSARRKRVLRGSPPRCSRRWNAERFSIMFSVVQALDFLLLLLVRSGAPMLVHQPREGLDRDPLQAVAAARRRGVAARARGTHRDRAAGSRRRRLRSPERRSIATSSRRCWTRGSAMSGSCRLHLRSRRLCSFWRAAARRSSLERAVLPAVLVSVYAIALRTRERPRGRSRSSRTSRTSPQRPPSGSEGSSPCSVLAAPSRRARQRSKSSRSAPLPRFSGMAVVAVSWLIAQRDRWAATSPSCAFCTGSGGELEHAELLLVQARADRAAAPARPVRQPPRSATSPPRGSPRRRERTRFLRMTGVELALIVAVVGVTAVLVREPPARAESHRGARTPPPRRSATSSSTSSSTRPRQVQPDPSLPHRRVGTADQRRRGQSGELQPGDRPTSLEAHPPARPLSRPRRATRPRRQLAAPRRGSPRRVRLGDHDRLGPHPRGTH